MKADFGSETAREALEELGRFIAGVYDTSLGQAAIPLRTLREEPYKSMSHEELAAVRRVLPDVVRTVLFELLAGFEYQEITGGPVRLNVEVDGAVVENPADCSDKLPGELLTADGWLARFAKNPPDDGL